MGRFVFVHSRGGGENILPDDGAHLELARLHLHHRQRDAVRKLDDAVPLRFVDDERSVEHDGEHDKQNGENTGDGISDSPFRHGLLLSLFKLDGLFSLSSPAPAET